jgi:ubiquinone/menaquinone biosynthesis C-methylase UbiE
MPPNDQSSSLTQRALSERQFYNSYAERLDVSQIDPSRILAPTCLENEHLIEKLGELRGKRVLDIGCGQGDTTTFLALRGAEVWALDVADRMVEFTRQLAAHHGVADRVRAETGRVEDMKYPSDFFDLVFADGVLHHLDLSSAVPNLVRVMKPGGRGFFLEPQRGSVFIEIYRLFARDLRTADERPLNQHDLDYFAGQFRRFDHHEYHFLSLSMFGIRFLQLKLQGKAFPYWMEDIRAGKWHPRTLRCLQRIDEFLLTRFRFLRKYCWMTVIVVQK